MKSNEEKKPCELKKIIIDQVFIQWTVDFYITFKWNLIILHVFSLVFLNFQWITRIDLEKSKQIETCASHHTNGDIKQKNPL